MNHYTHIEPRAFTHLAQVKAIPTPVLEDMKRRYTTAVARTNEILDRLREADRTASNTVFSDMRSLLGALPTTLATVKSYELFFSQLGSRPGVPARGVLADRIARDFGSHAQFLDEFVATALASRGWAAVAWDLDLQRLMCMIGDTPEQLTVWNNTPVIVVDVTERGLDTGTERSTYVRTLVENLDWQVVERNLENALGLTPVGRSH